MERKNSTDVQGKRLAIPSNTYRAVLEVFVSFHANDEFWYTNPPNEYIEANNLSNVPGNGAFREVVVKVNDDIVGAIWPFTVIYTGGVNPLLWRPITGIGSFNLPTYDIDITPFLGKLLDGKEHDFGFGVTNALDVWYIDANLHLWLDQKSEETTGSLISYEAQGLVLNVDSGFSGLDGQFVTSASRHISATGLVKSSYGEVTTNFYQRFSYVNSNVYSKNGSVQLVNQTIDAKSGVFAKDALAVLLSEELHQIFPLYVYTGTSDEEADEYTLISYVKLGVNEKETSGGKMGFSYNSLRNAQSAHGSMKVKKNLALAYKYVGADGCYFRDVRSKNYTVLSDHSGDSCTKKNPYNGAKFSLRNDQSARRNSCLLALLLLLLLPIAPLAAPRRSRFPSTLRLASFDASPPPPPTTFFEVDRPIRPPRGSVGPCSTLLLSHSFGYTYGRGPVTAAYAPPACLAAGAAAGGSIALAVLEWSADCRGRQFDRIFGVWLSGAELLRSCTAEPRATGIVWSVSRDVTRYAALLAEPGEIAVYLGNLVDSTYTGVYHANLTLHLYFHPAPPPPPPPQQADLIVPISRSLPLNDGQWFAIQNSTDVQGKRLAIPSNTYRAVLEVFVSFHANDEFWYTNPPNEYIEANNLSNVPGNGAFREVVVKVNDDIVGAIWPFTVIYTGGVNPLLWRPITGIGSFNLPTYDIDITPFLGKLLDGKEHDFGFGVTNALDVWYIDANLHLWLDQKSEETTGSLISYEAQGLVLNVDSGFSGLDGQFVTSASRHISATGLVKSSYGEVTTNFYQRFSYVNSNVYSKNGSVQLVNQTIDAKSGVFAKDALAVLLSEELHQIFPLYVYTGTSDEEADEYTLISYVKLGVNEKETSGGKMGFSYNSLRNAQSAHGSMKVKKNLVVGGLGETHQAYKYVGADGCYFRDVRSKNYTVLSDHSGDSCTKKNPYNGAKFSLRNDQSARRKLMVDRPIRPPRGSVGPCSTLLLSNSFGATYGRPPVTAAYAPPSCLAVLEWSADCRGRQFDRIFGVWLSGAELLRSCTAEPRATGIVWSVSRDVSRYTALLAAPGEVAVYLGNLIDDTYTGVYHANLTLNLYFHPAAAPPPPEQQQQQHAHLILPISRSLPLNDGQWFAIQNSTDVQSKKLVIPSNTYRAVLEVFVSFHSNDEDWYMHPPNEYIEANNISSLPGNGAFREITVQLDGDVVGAVWPFTVIYTGGVNPLFWRPITAIGSFNLPTYDIDITPFLGKLLDGKEHNFGFSVTNALDVWFIDANLHIWLDHKSEKTFGSLVSYEAPKLTLHVDSNFSALDGRFVTSAGRHISATGWVNSSYGNVMTTFYQRFSYKNSNLYSKNGTFQVVNQTIDAKSGVFAKSSVVLFLEEVHRTFPLYIFSGTSDQVGDEYSLVSVVKMGFNERRISGRKQEFSYISLRNAQSARGYMKVKKNLVVDGLGETHQVYKYAGTDGCYSRFVGSRNYTIIFDNSGDVCSKGSPHNGPKFSSVKLT
uniref:Peptide N-acetyl-beta-D-glucosaminyl asparaginase amidase A N-terminal domain-containing protein n=1 Tax=Oryza barthii TaxID=65489 RepID=A0A0D3EKX5_9ORYZ